jgi:Site-specific recombinase XerD
MAQKRGHGEGTVRFNSQKGYWEARFTYADPITGEAKRKMFTGKSQREALTKGRKKLKQIENGLLPDAEKLLLGTWIDRWLEDYVKARVRVKSFDKYEGCLKCYIKPYLGSIPLGKLRSPDIQQLFNKLLKEGGRPFVKKLKDDTVVNLEDSTEVKLKGDTVMKLEDGTEVKLKDSTVMKLKGGTVANLEDGTVFKLKDDTVMKLQKGAVVIEEKRGISTSTVKATRRYLGMALDQAVKVGLIAKNIVKDTDAPKLVKKEICPLTKEQAAALTAVAKAVGEIPYMAVLLPLATGMRLGEVFGLKWDCVDLEQGLIHVKRSLITGIKGYNGERLQEPKTAKSRRQIPLPLDVTRELRKYKKWQEWQQQLLGNKYIDNNLVLPNQWGQFYDTSNFTTRIFKKMLTKAGIDESFKFHDLRHTHATLLLLQGVNPKIVQERLGHSTIAMTLDTYSHLLPNMQNVAAEALTGMLISESK